MQLAAFVMSNLRYSMFKFFIPQLLNYKKNKKKGFVFSKNNIKHKMIIYNDFHQEI